MAPGMQIIQFIKRYKDIFLAVLLILNLIAWGVDHWVGRSLSAQNIEGPPGALAPGLRIGYERREYKVGGIYILKYVGKQEDGAHLFVISRD
ncbi:MAG TPA: hypothetical protein VNM22_03105 [Candidatus Limnocylindrales bacterium]|nr:hypothetical protein [Candidatus Limnocylindrales bacterium]